MRLWATLVILALVGTACGKSTSSVTGGAGTPAWRSFDCTSAYGSPPQASDQLRVGTAGWKTDFAKHCVPLSEIGSGGPPRDGIPPLDRPRFYAARDAERWLRPQEPVIAVTEGDAARAYPLQILIWHEIVNDTLAGRPIVVTFCPLCNASLVFDRRVAERELTFGTTGNLRYSDLVMWDRQTESWWQQAAGEAIVGELTGARLARVRSTVLSFQEFRGAYPSGEVLSREGADEEMKQKGQGRRHYGNNPYVTSATTARIRRPSPRSGAIARSTSGCRRKHASPSRRSRNRRSRTPPTRSSDPSRRTTPSVAVAWCSFIWAVSHRRWIRRR